MPIRIKETVSLIHLVILITNHHKDQYFQFSLQTTKHETSLIKKY